ncbi:MAG: hypothetical protein J0L92_01460 [Deltaproteobacteria bacterium]|nr:hypothetical protein [Deltaproteobacteria bacterium]
MKTFLRCAVAATTCWLALGDVAEAQSWGQTQILSPSDGTAGVYFGWALDVDGDTAVVGAPAATTPAGAQGAVYVFERGPTGWTERARLVAPEVAAERFGAAVSISGDSVVIGAPRTSAPGAAESGAAYVFTRTAGVWDTGVRLPASDSFASSQFGNAVTIDGDYVAVGPLGTDAVYVFVRGSGGWTQQVRLTRNPFELTNGFGRDVSLSGTALLIGADLADGPSGVDSGAALIYRRSGSTWTEEAHVYGGAAGNHFGQSVAIDGDYAVIGEPDYDGGYTSVGAAAVYRRVGVTWSRGGSTTLMAHSGARFGATVDIDGSTVAISEFFGAGRAHLFTLSGATASFVTTLTASDATSGERFGSALAISGTDLFGGLNLGTRRQAYVFGLLDDDGTACTTASSCLSGNCVDGVCCNSACGGGSTTDCQACSTAAGGTSTGSCTTLSAARAPTVTCRAAAGSCDAAEVCTSASTACPTDRVSPSTTVCRASMGSCDVAESCTGSSATCPDDAFAASSVVCRVAAAVCDVAESCTGSSATCPANTFVAAGVECRGASCTSGLATASASCTGSDGACPASSSEPCDPYVCGPTACRTSCASDAECTGGRVCLGSVCTFAPDAGPPPLDAAVPPPPDASIPPDASMASSDAGIADDAALDPDAAPPTDDDAGAPLEDDAGSPMPTPDAGIADAGARDAGPHDGGPSDTGSMATIDADTTIIGPPSVGCACRTTQAGTSSHTGLACSLLLLLALVLRRRGARS